MNRRQFLTTLSAAPAAASVIPAAQSSPSGFLTESVIGSRPVVVVANDKLELAVAKQGGAMIRLLLKGDSEGLSPFGNFDRLSYLTDQQKSRGPLGHFVCVDGFGPVSQEERAAGLVAHGEAQTHPWEILSSGKEGAAATVTFSVKLPLLQQVLARSMQMVDGENVIYIDSELQSNLAFDHPVNWGEHCTFSPPFLEPEKMVADMSGSRSLTRTYADDPSERRRRLASNREFTWPVAPSRRGGTLDLRPVPANPDSMDHTTTLMDKSRQLCWVTALNTTRQYLLGYIFRREEYPWIQTYEGYYPNPTMIRALEFSTQHFGLPRRTVIDMNSLFGTPLYRWLPAKSKITSRFLMFYTKTPAGMSKIDDVTLEGGRITVEDRAAAQRVTLAASLPL